MTVCRTIVEVRREVAALRAGGATIGLAPTMGALHAGHLALIAAARAAGHAAVVSIFVNPTQFGPGEDLERYPRDEVGDLEACRAAGAALVFAPPVDEMYRGAPLTRIHVERLTAHLCGPYRPGHFEGVATVVAKLLNIVQPDAAFFGQKDAQQLAVIRRMVSELDLPVEITGCPTVREPDGLALSSRNRYLAPDDRARAVSLVRALHAARAALAGGERGGAALEGVMRATLEAGGVERVDYASVVDADELQPLERVEGPALAAIAAWIGRTRLIDNLALSP